MSYAILQPFRTPLHRFYAGMEIESADIDGPLLPADWESMGFLGEPEPIEEDIAELREQAADLGLPVENWGGAYLVDAIEAEIVAQAEEEAVAAADAEIDAATYTVTEDFVTPYQRLREGMEISGADLIIDSPDSVDDWVELGFLEEAE